MSKKAKIFQEMTANRIEEIFRGGEQKRVLLADEVGLGKTIIAREVIDRVRNMRKELHDDMYRVVYVCSNINIVHQNTRNLGMKKRLDISESRLSMQHLVIHEQVALLKTNGHYREDGHYDEGEMPELLIPLTPGTSFAMQQGCGNKNERALMYCIISRLPEYERYTDRLYQFFKLYENLKEDPWRWMIGGYDQRVQACGERYILKIAERLERNNLFQEWSKKLREYLDTGSQDRNTKSRILVQLRVVFAQISIEELEPDFVIMDEFQRFSSLIEYRPDDDSEQTLITRKFFNTMDNENAPLILLLSATPYKPYTTLEELNEENCDTHYEDFIKLTNFLFTGAKAAEFKTIWQKYSLQLSQLSTDNFDVLIASKKHAEEKMYGAMCRTERLMNSLIDMTHQVEEVPVSEGDIMSYCQMQRILRDCKERAKRKGIRPKYYNVPMEYVKASPYLLSFMEKYELKKYIINMYKGRNSSAIKLPISNWVQNVVLNFDRIYAYKPLSPNNARLAKLQQMMLDEKAQTADLLWVPASHPYYRTNPSNVFERNRDFSKILVFSSWEMVPRMIAVMLSYEAERQTIGEYSGGHKKASYTNDVGVNPLRGDRDILLFYNNYLRDLYRPEDFYGQDVSDIRTSLIDSINKRIDELGGYVVDGKCFDSEQIIPIAKWLESGESSEQEIPSQIVRVLADMAIASPAIVLYRRIGNIDFQVIEAGHKEGMTLTNVIDSLVGLFNMRQSVGIMYRLYGDEQIYFEHVLQYCVDGNLQSVIDEFIHMIDETGENKADIAHAIYESFAGVSTLEIDTTEYYKDMSRRRRRLRTHYALAFTNKKVDEKNVTRAINVRQAFNSPFRPFVLSTTSIGQEGLDFHWYCRKIMHWNVPSNPQDMEQREGRINRYKCLAIRRNIAKKYTSIYDWNKMFQQAFEELEGDLGGLIPYWCIPVEEFDNPEKIERIVPMYPLSSDREYYERMNAVLSLYRLTMGQPRQEELITMFKNLTVEQTEKMLFNLSPIKRSKENMV